MSSKRLWWFLLANNFAVLMLFGYKLVENGHLIIGEVFPPENWQLNTSASRALAGAIPFIFSFGFLLWKVTNMNREQELNTLDHEEIRSHS